MVDVDSPGTLLDDSASSANNRRDPEFEASYMYVATTFSFYPQNSEQTSIQGPSKPDAAKIKQNKQCLSFSRWLSRYKWSWQPARLLQERDLSSGWHRRLNTADGPVDALRDGGEPAPELVVGGQEVGAGLSVDTVRHCPGPE